MTNEAPKKPLSMKERAALVGTNLRESAVSERDTPPKTLPGRSLLFHVQSKEMEEKIALLENQLGQVNDGLIKKIALAKLHKVEGRQRNLTIEERTDLLENLRNNVLITPITVTKRPDGDFDIVAGNNRYDIYNELEREDIEAFIINLNNEQADVSAFYSNLLHPSLPDFEKYIGFKKIMLETKKSQTEIARESGLDKKSVSKIMSFDGLPDIAKEILKEHPTRLGATAAAEFSQLTENGKGNAVIEAIKEIVFRNVSQATAVAHASKAESKPVAVTKLEPLRIKSGNSTFAEIRSTGNTLRIDFKDEKKREEFAVIFFDLIKQHVDAGK